MPTAKQKPLRPPLSADAKTASRISDKVDELGDIDRKLAPMRSLIAREELLKKSIRAAYAERTAESTFEVRGRRFIVLLGAKGNQSVINYAKLWRLAGVDLMKRIATVTLKALEEHAPVFLTQVVSMEPTGSRSLKVLELGSEAKAA